MLRHGVHGWVVLLLGAGAAVTCGGCQDAQGRGATAPGQGGPGSRLPASALERLLPLMRGLSYVYLVESEEGQDSMLARAVPEAGNRATFRLPGGIRHFEFGPDAIRQITPSGTVTVLTVPLAPGTSWRGERGSQVVIEAVDAVVDVPAGRFAGCVRTLERRGGDMPLQVYITYCPDVGIVQLDAARGQQTERAVLQSFGAPVDLGPDGVRRIP
jgi:hypothetical protein